MEVARRYIRRLSHPDPLAITHAESRDDAALVNGLCASLEITPGEKQFLLEADGTRARAGRLIELLRPRLEAFPAGPSSDVRSDEL